MDALAFLISLKLAKREWAQNMYCWTDKQELKKIFDVIEIGDWSEFSRIKKTKTEELVETLKGLKQILNQRR